MYFRNWSKREGYNSDQNIGYNKIFWIKYFYFEDKDYLIQYFMVQVIKAK